jgi:hypothetical protein
VSDVKVVINDTCESRERAQIVKYLQDTFWWIDGKDFEVRQSAKVATTDELHTCVDCGSPFSITSGEQEFFAKNKLRPPKRCKPCRNVRKAEKQNGGDPGNSRKSSAR